MPAHPGDKCTERQAGMSRRPEVLKSGISFIPHPSSEQPHKSGIPSGLYGATLLYDWNEERLDMVGADQHYQSLSFTVI
jgi:hypothetical protein